MHLRHEVVRVRLVQPRGQHGHGSEIVRLLGRLFCLGGRLVPLDGRHVVFFIAGDGHAEFLLHELHKLLIVQHVVGSVVDIGDVLAGQRRALEAREVEPGQKQCERRDLREREVGSDVVLHGGIDPGQLRKPLLPAQLVEDGEQHALLPVVAAHIRADALARAAIVQHLLPVKVLEPRLQRAAVQPDPDVHIVVHAAHRVDQALEPLHVHARVVVDRHAHEHLDRFLRVEEALALRRAALGKRRVDLPAAARVVDGRVGVARDGDEVHGVLAEVDGGQHHHIRAVVVPLVAVERVVRVVALGALVVAEQQDVDPPVHEGEVGLLAQRLLRRERGARRGSRRVGVRPLRPGDGRRRFKGAFGPRPNAVQARDRPGQRQRARHTSQNGYLLSHHPPPKDSRFCIVCAGFSLSCPAAGMEISG